MHPALLEENEDYVTPGVAAADATCFHMCSQSAVFCPVNPSLICTGSCTRVLCRVVVPGEAVVATGAGQEQFAAREGVLRLGGHARETWQLSLYLEELQENPGALRWRRSERESVYVPTAMQPDSRSTRVCSACTEPQALNRSIYGAARCAIHIISRCRLSLSVGMHPEPLARLPGRQTRPSQCNVGPISVALSVGAGKWWFEGQGEAGGLGAATVMSATSVSPAEAQRLLPGLSGASIERAALPIPARHGKNFNNDTAILSRGASHLGHLAPVY